MKRKPRILIFDDDQNILNFLERLLMDKGCDVITYPYPELCPLQKSDDCPCRENELCADIVITDIHMVRVTGLDFIENLLEKGCTISNIGIMSGLWSGEKRNRAENLGCAVIEKPFNISALVEWIDECIARIDQNKVLTDWFLCAGYRQSSSAEQVLRGDST